MATTVGECLRRLLTCAPEAKDDNLRSAADANRQWKLLAYSTRDVKGGSPVSDPSVSGPSAACSRHRDRRPVSGQDHLSAVRVSREHSVHTNARVQMKNPVRVVGQDDGRDSLRWLTAHEWIYVPFPHVVHPRDA